MLQDDEFWRELQAQIACLPTNELPLAEEIRRAAFDYAVARGRWQLADQEGRAGMEQARSLAHDRFIDACNALSRACGRHDLAQNWRRRWGDGRSGEERRRIGDFACFIAWKLMVEAR